jgi:hypothetical protein
MSASTDEDVDVVVKQTGFTDKEHIASLIKKHNNNLVNVICELQGIESVRAETPAKMSKAQQAIAEVRMIVDEKEAIFHNVMKQARGASGAQEMGLK